MAEGQGREQSTLFRAITSPQPLCSLEALPSHAAQAAYLCC